MSKQSNEGRGIKKKKGVYLGVEGGNPQLGKS
jgi:hypothetical protein